MLTAYSEKQSCTFLICHKCVAQLVTVFFPYPCQKCLHHGVIFYFSCIMNVNTDGWASTVYAACRERTDCVGIQYCNTQSTCKPLFLSKYTYRVLHTHTHTHPPTTTHTHTPVASPASTVPFLRVPACRLSPPLPRTCASCAEAPLGH